MAYESSQQLIGTLIAGEDLSDWQYRPVDISSAGIIKPLTAASMVVGILQYGVKKGEACTICFGGLSKVWTADIGDTSSGSPVTNINISVNDSLGLYITASSTAKIEYSGTLQKITFGTDTTVVEVARVLDACVGGQLTTALVVSNLYAA